MIDISIKYDRSLRIAGVGPTPWPKLGPEQWFEHYKIVSEDSCGLYEPYLLVLDLNGSKADTQSIVNSSEFIDVARDSLADYKFITYKPVPLPAELGESRFVANPREFARFENKQVFRDTFKDTVPLPDFVSKGKELFTEDPSTIHGQLVEKFGSYVIQDEALAGGRGTRIVHNLDDFISASEAFSNLPESSNYLISKYIDGRERSVMAVATDQAVVVGPLQQQFVREPVLQDVSDAAALAFCGAMLIDDERPSVEEEIIRITRIVGSELKSRGYRGIFGVDYLVSEADDVYAIEINARTTGTLPLVNEQMTTTPIYLLHILELLGESYNMLDNSGLSVTESGPNGYINIFNKQQAPVYLNERLVSGNYRFRGGKLEQIDSNVRWNQDEADILIHRLSTPKQPAAHNQKICAVFLRENVASSRGELSSHTKDIVEYLRSQSVTKG